MSHILCDYCDAIATRFVQRGDPLSRSFACDEHTERARNACYLDEWSDPPLPGRSRFEDERAEYVEARWRRGAKQALMENGSRLARAIYERHLAGCCLHIVLDDGNVEDSSVNLCFDTAEREGHADCCDLASILQRMTKTQRRKVALRR